MARNLGVKYTENKPFYFVSYNSEDERRVKEYAAELVKAGVPIWYDVGLKIGGEWELQIAQKIDDCQAVIMFLSKNIFQKEDSYVHREFELAREYSNKTVYIMMLDEIKKPEVPLRFRPWWTKVTKLQCINTYEYPSTAECVNSLVYNIGIVKSNNEPEEKVTVEEKIISDTKPLTEKESLFEAAKEVGSEAQNQGETEKEFDKIIFRLKMCAQTYGMQLNENLSEFTKWLINSRGFSCEEAHQHSRNLIYISKDIIDLEWSDIPVFQMADYKKTRSIVDKVITSISFKNKSYVKKQGNESIRLYCSFFSEKEKNNVDANKSVYIDESLGKTFKNILDKRHSTAKKLGIPLRNELDEFVKWLIKYCKFTENTAYAYGSSLIYISSRVINSKELTMPIYQLDEPEMIMVVWNKYKLKGRLDDFSLKYDTAIKKYVEFMTR